MAKTTAPSRGNTRTKTVSGSAFAQQEPVQRIIEMIDRNTEALNRATQCFAQSSFANVDPAAKNPPPYVSTSAGSDKDANGSAPVSLQLEELERLMSELLLLADETRQVVVVGSKSPMQAVGSATDSDAYRSSEGAIKDVLSVLRFKIHVTAGCLKDIKSYING